MRCPACPRWSSALRSCRSPLQVRGSSRAHTWCAHALWRGRSCVRVGAYLQRLAVGVFARGRLGLGVCATARVRLWCLRALVCALAWGWWDNHYPAAPAPFAWLALTLWCGLEKRVREPVGGQVRGGNGAGQSCPAPCAAGWRCRRCVRVEERRLRVGVPARSGEHNPTPSLALAYMETGSHPVGAKQRRGSHRPGVVAWLGAGCVSSASALVAGTFPVPVARGGWWLRVSPFFWWWGWVWW